MKEPGVPLSRTILRGYGLWARAPLGDILSGTVLTLAALPWKLPFAFRAGDIRASVIGDFPTEGVAAFNKAFVKAELIGGAISSSELSFRE